TMVPRPGSVTMAPRAGSRDAAPQDAAAAGCARGHHVELCGAGADAAWAVPVADRAAETAARWWGVALPSAPLRIVIEPLERWKRLPTKELPLARTDRRGVVHIPDGTAPPALAARLAHELAHAVPLRTFDGDARLPDWLDEGSAQWLEQQAQPTSLVGD